MSLAISRTSDHLRAALSLPIWRRVSRWLLLAVGGVLMLVGMVGSVLPGHLGLPVLVLGLILVLRSSFQARRRFIGLQRQHPKIVYPIRRLLRRNPELAPVAWQQVLRFERLVMPKSWRFAMRVRHAKFRQR
jgi:hypothetical protein